MKKSSFITNQKKLLDNINHEERMRIEKSKERNQPECKRRIREKSYSIFSTPLPKIKL
jgi:hypothetical protein